MTKKTKLIRYRVAGSSPNASFKIGKYTFTYDKNIRPIPVEVDAEMADIMLQMKDRPCRCHYKKPVLLFEEVFSKK